MRLKKIKNAYETISKSNYFVCEPQKYKSKWNELFNNNSPIELEIGMGKGDFIIKKAITNPNINYIGLEKYDSVLVYAIKKLNDIEIKNLKLINENATNITDIFDKEINKIYLNFSDPWPKKKHHRRRLTHENFLKLYDLIFKDSANIELKSDNDDFFEDSLKSFEEYGYNIIEVDRNRNDEFKTEYEKKFTLKGKNINYVSIYSKIINNK